MRLNVSKCLDAGTVQALITGGIAITLPYDGVFCKLIAFRIHDADGKPWQWIHRDYRLTEKPKKKVKKRG